MDRTNFFILVCTFTTPCTKRLQFGANHRSSKFKAFKRRLRLSQQGQFPAASQNGSAEDRILSEHLSSVRRLDKKHYLVAGCSHANRAAAVVDAGSLMVVRPVIPSYYTIHDFVSYQNILLLADMNNQLVISGLDTPLDKMLKINAFKLSNSSFGTYGLNCGRHMAIDNHVVYLMCDMDYFVTLSLKDVNPESPSVSQIKSSVKAICRTPSNACFFIGKTFVYILGDQIFIRVRKESNTAERLVYSMPKADMSCMVGSDYLAFAISGKCMYLLGISDSEVTLLDNVESRVCKSELTRKLIPAQIKGISFVIRIQEAPAAVSIYAALKNRLHIILEHNLIANGDRVLGATYDSQNQLLILCKEKSMSQIFKLSY